MRTRTVTATLSLLATAMVLTGVQGPVRAATVLAFALAAPGLAWAGHLPVRTTPETAALVVGLSLGVDIVVALVLLKTGLLTPVAMVTAVTAITLIGAATAPTVDAAEVAAG